VPGRLDEPARDLCLPNWMILFWVIQGRGIFDEFWVDLGAFGLFFGEGG
jgi:hypothetical protein